MLKIADHVAFLELGHVVWSGPRASVDDEQLASVYLGGAGLGRPMPTEEPGR